MAEIRHFLCIFACDGCFGVSFVAVYVGGVWRARAVCCCGWWFCFCVMWWGRADFRGIGCRRVRDDGAVGCSVVIVLWV